VSTRFIPHDKINDKFKRRDNELQNNNNNNISFNNNILQTQECTLARDIPKSKFSSNLPRIGNFSPFSREILGKEEQKYSNIIFYQR